MSNMTLPKLEQLKWFLKGMKHILSLIGYMKPLFEKEKSLSTLISAIKQEIEFCKKDIADRKETK